MQHRFSMAFLGALVAAGLSCLDGTAPSPPASLTLSMTVGTCDAYCQYVVLWPLDSVARGTPVIIMLAAIDTLHRYVTRAACATHLRITHAGLEVASLHAITECPGSTDTTNGLLQLINYSWMMPDTLPPGDYLLSSDLFLEPPMSFTHHLRLY